MFGVPLAPRPDLQFPAPQGRRYLRVQHIHLRGAKHTAELYEQGLRFVPRVFVMERGGRREDASVRDSVAYNKEE